MPCKAPLMPVMTFQISPPLKVWGVSVSSVHISASLSFHVPSALSRLLTTQLSLIVYTSRFMSQLGTHFFWANLSHHADGGQDFLGKGDK